MPQCVSVFNFLGLRATPTRCRVMACCACNASPGRLTFSVVGPRRERPATAVPHTESLGFKSLFLKVTVECAQWAQLTGESAQNNQDPTASRAPGAPRRCCAGWGGANAVGERQPPDPKMSFPLARNQARSACRISGTAARRTESSFATP
jgi:hypothetical protein